MRERVIKSCLQPPVFLKRLWEPGKQNQKKNKKGRFSVVISGSHPEPPPSAQGFNKASTGSGMFLMLVNSLHPLSPNCNECDNLGSFPRGAGSVGYPDRLTPEPSR